MAKGSNTGAVIFLAILAVAGLGLSGYMFTMDLLSKNEEFGNLKLVALWDYLEANFDTPTHATTSNFLVAYDEQVVLDTKYVNVVNETRFLLPTSGIYKINLNVLLNPVTAGEVYWVVLLANNTFLEDFERVGIENPATTPFWYAKGSVYVNVTGGIDTYYQINVYGTPTGIGTAENFNQLSIEYVLD